MSSPNAKDRRKHLKSSKSSHNLSSPRKKSPQNKSKQSKKKSGGNNNNSNELDVWDVPTRARGSSDSSTPTSPKNNKNKTKSRNSSKSPTSRDKMKKKSSTRNVAFDVPPNSKKSNKNNNNNNKSNNNNSNKHKNSLNATARPQMRRNKSAQTLKISVDSHGNISKKNNSSKNSKNNKNSKKTGANSPKSPTKPRRSVELDSSTRQRLEDKKHISAKAQKKRKSAMMSAEAARNSDNEGNGKSASSSSSHLTIRPVATEDITTKIYARVRGLMPWEPNRVSVKIMGNKVQNKTSKTMNEYLFSKVFTPQDDNSKVFKTVVLPMISNVLQGFNAVLIAYGQTGSGKTYSMLGKPKQNIVGLLPMMLEHMVQTKSVSKVELSAVEAFAYHVAKIELFDLFDPVNQTEIWTDKVGNTSLNMLEATTVSISDADDAHEKIIVMFLFLKLS